MIEKVARIVKLSDESSDYEYWRSRSPLERLKALEEIREEYNRWKYTDAEQRFQRVYTIAKLSSG